MYDSTPDAAIERRPHAVDMLTTPVCELFGMIHPVVLGGMGLGTNPDLVAAVSNAGGLGIQGCGGRPPGEITELAATIRDRTDRPFGLNLLLFMAGEAEWNATLSTHPPVVSTAWAKADQPLAELGDGFNGPLLITVVPGAGVGASPGAGDAAEAVEGLRQALARTPGVAAVTEPVPNDPTAPEAFLMTLMPTTAPQAEATSGLVARLREDVIPAAVTGTELDVKVTGTTAANIDLTGFLGRRVLLFFGVVMGLSFVLLLMVFRSLLVPFKAVIMNVLSMTATYGVVVAVFQWGWGGDLLGIAGAPIEPFIPMILFAIVFGLSMDYEVFLLSRVREEYARTNDAVESVADGLAATARVITAAAAIMVVVFGSFVLEDDRVLRMFGLGLAVAVLLDATLIRMLLVPATMALLGARKWWMPRWLDRLVPRLSAEGTGADADGHDNAPSRNEDETGAPARELQAVDA